MIRPRRGLPASMLKLGSVVATGVVLLGSLSYASANVYNAKAPLQPAVPGAVSAPQPTIAPSRGRTRPNTSIGPNVRTSDRAPLTSTHSS